jgi:hypothetical protein
MSDNFNLEGKILIESRDHAVEYEPSAMVGLGTVFLRIKTVKHVVPIHLSQIDDVVKMLQRGKRAIEAFEGREAT